MCQFFFFIRALEPAAAQAPAGLGMITPLLLLEIAETKELELGRQHAYEKPTERSRPRKLPVIVGEFENFPAGKIPSSKCIIYFEAFFAG